MNERIIKSTPEAVERRRRMIAARMALTYGSVHRAESAVSKALATVGDSPTPRKQKALMRDAWQNVGAERGGEMAERIVRTLAGIASNPEAETNPKLQQGAIMAAQTLASLDRSMGKAAVEEEAGSGAPQITVIFEGRPGGRPLPERGVQMSNGRTIDLPRIQNENP